MNNILNAGDAAGAASAASAAGAAARSQRSQRIQSSNSKYYRQSKVTGFRATPSILCSLARARARA